MLKEIKLREISDDDMGFLGKVYASTRAQEMEQVDWPDEQKNQFLAMQFEAQHQHYQKHYSGQEASFSVISVDGNDIGRLYVHRQPHDILIVDISILPQYSAKGYGTQLLQELLSEAKQTQSQVSIHVEENNSAMEFYLKLGFEDKGPNKILGLYRYMVWKERPKRVSNMA